MHDALKGEIPKSSGRSSEDFGEEGGDSETRVRRSLISQGGVEEHRDFPKNRGGGSRRVGGGEKTKKKVTSIRQELHIVGKRQVWAGKG